MNVYRKNSIPAIYLTIPWIRKPSGKVLFADCPEDIEYIKQMQNVCSGSLCLSSFDRNNNFMIKAMFPETWKDYDGSSDDLIQWSYYHWKVWDILYLIDNKKPVEAISLKQAGISDSYLESIENTKSCIPILKELRNISEYGDLTPKKLSTVKDKESSLLSQIKLRKMKGSAIRISDENQKEKEVERTTQVGLKLRKEILRRDNYRCIFCGTTSENTSLEVDHILPKAFIKKMCLSENLYTEKYNLCTTCKSCNREKRDILHPIDIQFYFEKFKDSSHPNNKILDFLGKIRDLQDS